MLSYISARMSLSFISILFFFKTQFLKFSLVFLFYPVISWRSRYRNPRAHLTQRIGQKNHALAHWHSTQQIMMANVNSSCSREMSTEIWNLFWWLWVSHFLPFRKKYSCHSTPVKFRSLTFCDLVTSPLKQLEFFISSLKL